MKSDAASALRTGGVYLCVMVGLVFVACNGGGAGGEPAGDLTEGSGNEDTPTATASPAVSPEPEDHVGRATIPTASPWPRPTFPTGEPQGSGILEAEDVTASPLPPVSPEELSDIGGDAPPPEGEIDPCTLVTKAEAEEILELGVADVWRHTHFFGGGNICEWSSHVMASFERDEPFSSIFLRLDAGFSEEEFLEFRKDIDGIGCFSGTRRVEGIGDSAYASGPTLDVFKGDTKLGLAVIVKDEPSLKAAKKVGLIALRRWPQDPLESQPAKSQERPVCYPLSESPEEAGTLPQPETCLSVGGAAPPDKD